MSECLRLLSVDRTEEVILTLAGTSLKEWFNQQPLKVSCRCFCESPGTQLARYSHRESSSSSAWPSHEARGATKSSEAVGLCWCWRLLWEQVLCQEDGHCSCSLQLYSPCQIPLVWYRNRVMTPLPAWLCLAAPQSQWCPRISPELSLKLLLWLSVLTLLSTGGKNLLHHYPAQLGGAGQGEETVAGTETSHFLPFLCYLSTLALQNSSHEQCMQRDATGVTSPPVLHPGLAPTRTTMYY